MWAMMPMLRVLLIGTVLGMLLLRHGNRRRRVTGGPKGPQADSPPVVNEGAVRLRHAMGVFLALDGSALAVGGVQQLGCQPFREGPAAPRPRRVPQPAHRQRGPAARPDVNPH